MKTRPLILLPLLHGHPVGDKIGVTGKFVTGLQAYADGWGGEVRVMMMRSQDAGVNLDNIQIDPKTAESEYGVKISLVDYADDAIFETCCDAAMVFGGLGYQQNRFARAFQKRAIPFVTTSEYSRATRIQIIEAETKNPFLRLRRSHWDRGQEDANIRTIRDSLGIQCNGTPTYEAYKNISDSALLYFDTRTRESALISEDALETRLARLQNGQPLHLVFSGRLDPMKGAHYLPAFAEKLTALGVDFRLSICGDGTVADRMRKDLAALDLPHVKMLGVLDFEKELLPFVKEEADLFICPHLQGDPSCTYMETFACGVPIAGFNNEAFAGLCEMFDVGWQVDLPDTGALARVVARLDMQRGRIAEMARSARTVALEHTYEATFGRRIEHLKSLAR